MLILLCRIIMNSTKEIINDLKKGKMVILVDDEDRENEGDLVVASSHISAEHINFMAKFGRGLICLTLTEDKCRKLKLPLMVQKNEAKLGTNFTVSIDAAKNISSGISASDRAKTIKAAIKKNANDKDIVRPGHIFPLIAHPGGVLYRAGHTEAGCDLASLAGLEPSSVICEILNEDGNMARLPDLENFAKQHKIKIGTIADIIEFRSKKEKLIKKIDQKTIQTDYGKLNLLLYSDLLSNNIHLALVKGKILKNDNVLVRVHEPLSILDFIKNTKHSWPPLKALELLGNEKKGVIVFLNYSESHKKLENIFSPNEKYNAKQDLRNYGIGSQILVDLGVSKMRLMASPKKNAQHDWFWLTSY